MAFNLLRAPALFSPGFNDLTFAVRDTVNVNQPNYRYVFKTYVNGALAATNKLRPRPDGTCRFSPDGILRNYLTGYFRTGATAVTQPALFALEYLLRLYCSPKPLRYAFSFFGLVDLLAVLPAILALAFADAQYLLIVRVIRMIRIFRILKLRQYLAQANFLLTALRSSRRKIIVFLVTVSSLVTVFGTLMYVIEGPANGFTSIPTSIYWAIVTLTTVGFGDITPKTPLGQMVASLVMITGYSIIAVPTGIFTAELTQALRQEGQLLHDCPHCSKPAHERSASFCSRCGSLLFPRRRGDDGS